MSNKKKPYRIRLLTSFADASPPIYLNLGDAKSLAIRSKKSEETLRCPVCGSTNFTLNPDGLWVCANCGTVIRPATVNEIDYESFEISGEDYTGLEKKRYALDTYEHREFYSVLTKLGLDYDQANWLKRDAAMLFEKLLKHARKLEIPVHYLYAITVYFTLKKHGKTVDLDSLITAMHRVRPWMIGTMVLGNLKLKKELLEEYIKRAENLIESER